MTVRDTPSFVATLRFVSFLCDEQLDLDFDKAYRREVYSHKKNLFKLIEQLAESEDQTMTLTQQIKQLQQDVATLNQAVKSVQAVMSRNKALWGTPAKKKTLFSETQTSFEDSLFQHIGINGGIKK